MEKVRLIWKQFKNLFWSFDIRPAQFILGVAGVLWSLMLFWDGDTFARQTYAGMREIADEHAWATVFFVLGSLSLWHTFAPIHTRLAGTFAKTEALISCAVWSTAMISMLLSQTPPPAAIAGDIAIATAAFWVYVRINLPSALKRRKTDA